MRLLASLALAAALPACAEAPSLQPSDFNHRRWTLALEQGQISLAFGERLFFEFEDGCRKVHGFARLQRDRLAFEADGASGQQAVGRGWGTTAA